MMKQARRWLPGRRLVLVGDGGFAAVSLARACVKNNGVMVSRLRWDAALSHPPGPQPPGKRGPKPLKGQRQRSLQGWAERADTPIIRGIAAAEGGHMIPSQGAVPIIRGGVVEGACGVGGGTGQQDEDCARAGVAKL